MEKITVLIVFPLFLCGCATVNFSANYYSPPPEYKVETQRLWKEALLKVPVKYKYGMSIVEDSQFKTAKGIPQIENMQVKLPDNFVKYIYQNYYQDRFKVLTCTFVHELSHTEYNLLSTPVSEHFQTDKRAIELLASSTACSAADYYKSLLVLRSYWFARKGVGGHAFNVGWNVLQVASLVYAGSAHFVDWFATDLDKRMGLLAKEYKLKDRGPFKRSRSPQVTSPSGEPDFSGLFLVKKSKN